MKVLVTGSSGFVGFAVARHFMAQGHEVIGLHRRAAAGAVAPGREVIADIGSAEAMASLEQEVGSLDAIVHAAASLEKGLVATEVSRVNCIGLQNMLRLASRWPACRFVFISGLTVIGVPRLLPITEEHPASPLTAYHASKLFGEHLVRMYAAQGGTATSLRVTAPVGPGMPKDRLLSVLVRRALCNEPIELSGRGTRRQNYVDVRDVARIAGICAGSTISGLFNVGGSSVVSNLELARRCIDRCGSTSQIVFSGRVDPEDEVSWDVSIEKARAELGFVPEFGIDDAIDAARSAFGAGLQSTAVPG